MQETRQNKIARLLQKELSVIFQQQTRAMQLSRQWLMAFSEKITLSPMVFIGCMIILLILVIAIIIANSYKIASGNPVKYLKDE